MEEKDLDLKDDTQNKNSPDIAPASSSEEETTTTADNPI